jgi:hypothetical protein
MLNKELILKIAEDYLIKNKYPIGSDGTVLMPDEEENEEYKQLMIKKNIAIVSFVSKYLDNPDPRYPLDPGVYIAYVNLTTGKVEVPPHM